MIPASLKKILTLCCYDRAISLSQFDDTSIEEVESFVRNIFNSGMMEENGSITDYLGRFSKNQSAYIIMSGEKKILKKISEICSRFYEVEDASPSTIPNENDSIDVRRTPNTQQGNNTLPIIR